MIILVDIDDTIADWGSLYDEYLDALGERAISIPRTKDHEVFDLYIGRTDQEKSVIHEVMNTPNFYRHLKLLPGAREALNDMVRDGHTVYLVTAPYVTNETCASDKIWWVNELLGPEWVNRLVITRDKTCVYGDVLIDDREDIAGAVDPTWTHIFFHQTRNKQFTDRDRVLSWTDDWKSVVYSKERE